MCLKYVAKRQIQTGLTELEVCPQLTGEAESMTDAGNRRQQTPLGGWRHKKGRDVNVDENSHGNEAERTQKGMRGE